MKRIIIHWTAGVGSPNSTDRKHYHYLIDTKGNIYKGEFSPEDNLNCSDGRYAMHTGGGNTGSIGVALCGMYGFKNSKSVGDYPLTRVQCERMFKLVSELAKKYRIPVCADNIMTHYEFGRKNPRTTSAGKIDIIYLPPFPEIKKDEIGEFIRGKIKWYLGKLS